jgi:CubicO group peptidase (beta-lactamase class C family)
MIDPGSTPVDSTTDGLVAGFVAPGFESVRAAFSANLRQGLEVGAGFAVSRRGVLIVDLWGGHADQARTALLAQDAIFHLWSATKGLAAVCIAMLVDHGKLSYESPVAKYWPEFARHGKQALTVGQLMSHQAGVCGPRQVVTIEDYYMHDSVAALLAAQEPFFEPGTAWGYHALAIGTLAEELVRRVDGRAMGAFFAAELATPLGLEAYLGLPEAQDHRQVRMIPPPAVRSLMFDLPNPPAYQAALENPLLDPSWPESRAWRAAGLAAAGGSADARSLARLYDLLANGGEIGGMHLISRATLAEATRERIAGVDQVLGRYYRWAAGFGLNLNGSMGSHQGSFGCGGWGGTMAFADPARGLGVGYVMNQMLTGDWGAPDPRLSGLLRATYAALDAA